MSQQVLFDRIARVKVYQTQTVPQPAGGDQLVQTSPVGKEFPSKLLDGNTGFRISFRVDKVAAVTSGQPNPITVRIYNLGADSRALVGNTKNTIVVEAGYGQVSKRIFKGQINYGVTSKEGPDYITEINAMDGLFAVQNSRVDLSIRTPVTASTLIGTLVGALKPQGVDPGIVMGVPQTTYNKGIVLSGSTVDRLKEICEKNDLQFSIQDGAVLILPYGSDRGVPAPVISERTGLIGIPQIRAQAGADNKATIVSLKTLMMPEIGVSQKIVLLSKFVSGIFITAKVTHDGDSFGGPWYTEMECV